MRLDAVDRALIAETQGGLPLLPEPFAEIGARLGLSEGEVIDRLAAMRAAGIIRRIAAAPNHYALGLTFNGMTVWDVADESAGELGARVGGLDFVSHCYLRPRALPDWPYNLFAMVHGTSREEVEEKRATIRAMLGEACRADDMLLSRRILKKTGLRLKRKE